MQISVIVPTKDRPKEVGNFVLSLDSQSFMPLELILVDASRRNDTEEIIKHKRKNPKYYIKYLQTRAGAAYQRNIGFKEARGEILLFLDDDVTLHRDYIKVVKNTFNILKKQPVGIVTGQVVNTQPCSNIIEKIFKKAFFLSENGKGEIKLSGFPSVRINNEAGFVRFASGCNIAIPRSIFADFLFDEKLGGYSYMEDVDLSYRVAKKYLVYYQPDAKLKHFPSTFRKYDSRELRKRMIQNHLYLFKKNSPKNILHIFAFTMSLIGVLASNLIFFKDLNACKGVIEGLSLPLKSKIKNVK